MKEYKISEHAKQRYAARIMNREDQNEITRYVLENENKIKADINKMIEHGKLIYSGKKSQTNGKGKVINVYLKDLWVVLIDEPASNVVTLYKIDLRCGDEDFNLQYIAKMLDLLEKKKQERNKAEEGVKTESNMYKEIIEDNTAQINTYKGYIKNLQETNDAYQVIIKNNMIKLSIADQEVIDVVNNLIGKKEF